VDFDGLEVYSTKPILIRGGSPFDGMLLPILIPKPCVNLTCGNAANAVGKMPPTVSTGVVAPKGKLTVNKVWVRKNGKPVDPPKSDVQLSFTAVPNDGGTPVNFVSFDRKSAIVELELGKEYVVTENYPSQKWQRQGLSSIPIRIGENNSPLTFTNVEVDNKTEAAAGGGASGSGSGDEKKGWYCKRHKVLCTVIGAIGVTAGIALFTPKDDEPEVVVVEQQKGASSSGTSAPFTAGSVKTIGFSFKF
jgi:hypothetical protein